MSIEMTDEATRHAARAERLACLQWTAFILILLGGSVGMWIYAAVLAISDPTMAVVPDYHEKALQWDKQLDVQRASKAAGWTIAVVPSPATDAAGSRELTLFVRDRDVRPVTGATGQLRMYHHARGKDIRTVALREQEPGTYVADVEMARSGTWQLEITLDRDDLHVENVMEFELAR